MKRFDNPQQVSVHLVSAMGCCDSAPSSSNIHLQQALLNQKQTLQAQMQILQQKSLMLPSVLELKRQIAFLEDIISKFQLQNEQARRIGLVNMNKVSQEFVKIESIETDRTIIGRQIQKDYILEVNLHKELRMQIEELILKIKLLHQSNNQIVRNFANVGL